MKKVYEKLFDSEACPSSDLLEKISIAMTPVYSNTMLKLRGNAMHWKTPASLRMKKARISKSKFKAMLIVFFETNGLVMTEWIP